MSEITLNSNLIAIKADASSTESITISADNIKVGTVYHTNGCITTGFMNQSDYQGNLLFECKYCGCFDNRPGNCKHCGAPLKVYGRR